MEEGEMPKNTTERPSEGMGGQTVVGQKDG